MRFLWPNLGRCLYLSLFLLLGNSPLLAQEWQWPPAAVTLEGIDNTRLTQQYERKLSKAPDSLSMLQTLGRLQTRLRQSGYAAAGLDSLSTSEAGLRLHYYQGPYFRLDSLHIPALSSAYWSQSGLEKLLLKQPELDWEQIESRLRYCLALFQNEGYPFALFGTPALRYQRQSPDTLLTRVRYDFDAGPYIRIDSLIIKGNPKESDAFLQALTRIRPGDAFNQSLIQDVPRLLNNSIYYENVKPPQVIFTPYQAAKVLVEVEKRQSSKLDVLLGILPASDNSRRLQFTGSIDVALVSLFGQGESLAFQFEKLTSSSQQTQLAISLPYLLRTPFQLEGELNLLKQEEDFQNLNLYGAGLYVFSPFLSAKVYVRNRNSRLLGEVLADTLLANPVQLDGSRQVFGLGFRYEKLDYRLNPSRGISAELEIGLGTRKIRENVRIKQEDPDFYQRLDLLQPTREIDFRLGGFVPLWPRHVLYLANQSYWLGLQEFLRNDQRQIGGGRSIRGFNENEFFTDLYSFFTLEYRLQLERNSYLFLFGDYAYVENRAQRFIRRPRGFGVGMNYGTRAGIISLIYAIGQSETQSFQPARGKIHVGFVNQF